MRRLLLAVTLALAVATALTLATAPVRVLAQAKERPLFRDIRAEAGITFQHHSAPEKKFIVESMSGGVALFRPITAPRSMGTLKSNSAGSTLERPSESSKSDRMIPGH